MIYDGIEFHVVEDMEFQEKSYRLSRLPRKIANQLEPVLRDQFSWFSTGVELRFRMTSDEVKLHLSAEPTEEAMVAVIYFGSIAGGWTHSTKVIGEGETVISIRYPEELKKLEMIEEEHNLPFRTRLVRVLLPGGICHYYGKEGETEPPRKGDTPLVRYLAYGSSITHGSLSLTLPFSYPSLIAEALGVDCINQGYAGSAFMEAPAAEYMVSRKDWDFATLELGVNMLGTTMSEGEYEQRVIKFLEFFAKDGRPVFITDIFLNNQDNQERARIFREIIHRNATTKNMFYTSGLQLLDNPAYISTDMVHPSGAGHRQIAGRWTKIIKDTLLVTE